MLKVMNVCKSVISGTNKLEILKNISLHIEEGKFIAIMGASGCGKSTLLSILAGIDHVTSGTVIIAGENMTAMSDNKLISFRNQNIGIVFQTFNLISSLSVKENVLLPVALSEKKIDMHNNVMNALQLVGMKDKADLKPRQLSGGEQQRVAIARAMVCKPKILLADEPTGALDSVNSELVMKLFKKLNTELNTTIIMVTHDKEMSLYCDKIFHMKDGKIQ